MQLKSMKRLSVALGLLGLATAANAESILELYTRTVGNNPTLKSRQLEVTQAEAQKDLALSRLLPQVSVDATRTPNITYSEPSTGVSQRYDGLRRSVQLRQALLDLSSWYRSESERSHVLQTQSVADAVRMMLGGDLVDRYLSALQAEDELARIESERETVLAQATRLRKMLERQMAKVTDVYEAEAYLHSLETKAIEARAARAIALEKLQELSGSPVTGVTGLEQGSLPANERSEAQWVDEALGRNPLLASRRLAVVAARNMVDSGRAQHAPTLALVAAKTYSDQGYDSRMQPPYSVGTVGLQLNVPIFEGGRVDATVRDALARHDIAEQQLEESKRELIRQVRSDYLHAAASRARIASTQSEAAAQQKVVDAQEMGYRLGATTIVDLLDARRRLLKARAEQSAATYDLVRNITALRVRAGLLDEGAMAEISNWFSRAGKSG